jgi:3-methyladenine DNA glycosylase AlkD
LSAESIIKEMRSKADPKAVAGMARFRISSENTLGLSVPTLRRMAEKLGRDHRLALGLWKSGIHEARILASMVDEPEKVTERQMDEWARDFDSWDVCDQCCGNLFDKTPYSFAKALEWSGIREEFVKRARVLNDGRARGARQEGWRRGVPEVLRRDCEGADDDRNFVKKAVNWALRQIRKRNVRLNGEALRLAERISKQETRSAKWVATDAIRELSGDAVQKELRRSS